MGDSGSDYYNLNSSTNSNNRNLSDTFSYSVSSDCDRSMSDTSFYFPSLVVPDRWCSWGRNPDLFVVGFFRLGLLDVSLGFSGTSHSFRCVFKEGVGLDRFVTSLRFSFLFSLFFFLDRSDVLEADQGTGHFVLVGSFLRSEFQPGRPRFSGQSPSASSYFTFEVSSFSLFSVFFICVFFCLSVSNGGSLTGGGSFGWVSSAVFHGCSGPIVDLYSFNSTGVSSFSHRASLEDFSLDEATAVFTNYSFIFRWFFSNTGFRCSRGTSSLGFSSFASTFFVVPDTVDFLTNFTYVLESFDLDGSSTTSSFFAHKGLSWDVSLDWSQDYSSTTGLGGFRNTHSTFTTVVSSLTSTSLQVISSKNGRDRIFSKDLSLSFPFLLLLCSLVPSCESKVG